jgi:endonuclease G, mitochondrial
MSDRASIAMCARKRITESAKQITHSLKVIAEGRPGDAEPDASRRAAVLQARRAIPFDAARREALKTGPESIWGKTIDFVGVAFFERGRRAARSVCRITQAGQPVGTGFLVSPRLLLTNNHVIGSPAEARAMALEFDYELDIDNQPLAVSRFSLAADEFFLTDDRDNLDYTVIAVGPRVAGQKSLAVFGALPLSNARNKHALGEFVNIIQHPDGRLKEAVVRENQLVGRPLDVGTVLHYVTDTEPGSSGSPVFNVLWNVVALHHWGGPHRDLLDSKGAPVPRTVNEGIRISAIFTDLNTRKSTLAGGQLALLEEALALGVESNGRVATDLGTENPADSAGGSGASVTVGVDGTATWRIPLSVSVRLGGLPIADRGTQPSIEPVLPSPDRPARGSEVKLVLDARYANRTGYKADFLSSVSVGLPKLSAAQKRDAAKNTERVQGDDPYVLRYEHFGVVMNARRRLAFFTATNIDGARSKDFNRDTGAITEPEGLGLDDRDEGPEAAELWLNDRRITDDAQTPANLFSGQTSFDPSGAKITNKQTMAHRNRIFQQGHLTRRQDPLWGTDAIVIRANTDTFHVTNRAPQIGYFNMGMRKRDGEAVHPGGNLHWRALEEFVLGNARADKKRVSVFTGPVFDDAHDFKWDRGRADMKGFKAPRKFWKVVLRIEKGRLHATALVADQSPLIDFRLPEMLELSLDEATRFSFDKVAKYQVSIMELQRQTGLDFGAGVRAADTFAPERAGAVEKRVVNIEEVSIERPRKGAAGRR